MKKIISLIGIISLFLIGCAKTNDLLNSSEGGLSTRGACYDPGINSFGSDFKTYLNNTNNSDLTGFGGSVSKTGDCAVTKQPVIFIHGNADDVNGASYGATYGGWKTSRDYFISKGYKPTELYAVNWGIPGATNASYNYHSIYNLSKVYRFILAVKNYTGASKVDIITHSLGVTLARRAIKGGSVSDYANGSLNLGSSLNSYVDTFVGIAGANRGLLSCGEWPLNVWAPTCGPHGLSVNNTFLVEANGGSAYAYLWWGIWTPNTLNMKIGSYTYSIKSWVDEVACLLSMGSTGCYVYSAHTSTLDGENGSKTYYTAPYGHFGLKSQTADVQYNMVVNHTY